jgi:hypothetical protein
MTKGSVRDYAINQIDKRTSKVAGARGSGAPGSNSSGGGTGGGIVGTHALDGPEHSEATETDRLLATIDHAGLIGPLSGDATQAWLGDGTWGTPSSAATNVEDLPTGDTDTATHLAPDGVGGVEFVPDAAVPGAGSAVGDRLRWNGSAWVASRLAWVPLMGNAPNLVTTDGSAFYVVVTTSTGDPIMVESLT